MANGNKASTLAAMYGELKGFGKAYRESDTARDDSITGAMKVFAAYVRDGVLPVSGKTKIEGEAENLPFFKAFCVFRYDSDNVKLYNDALDKNIRSKFKSIVLAAQVRKESANPSPDFVEVLESVDETTTTLRAKGQKTRSVIEAYYETAKAQRKNKDGAVGKSVIEIAARAATGTGNSTEDAPEVRLGKLMLRIANELDHVVGTTADIPADDDVKKALAIVRTTIDSYIPASMRKGKAAKAAIENENAVLRAQLAAMQAQREVHPATVEVAEKVIAEKKNGKRGGGAPAGK